MAGADPAAVEGVLRFAAVEVVPRLDATRHELDRVLHALDGGFIPAGPSGSPLRGLVSGVGAAAGTGGPGGPVTLSHANACAGRMRRELELTGG